MVLSKKLSTKLPLMNTIRFTLIFAILSSIFSLSVHADAEKQEEAKTIFITGANRGLGLEFATQYAAAGYHVIGSARSPERATELKAIGAEVVKLDVTSEEDIAALAEALKGRKIDILINNAGYFGPVGLGEKGRPTIENLTREEMTDCINVNTLGPIFVTQGLLPNLKLSKSPKIINVSTRSSILSQRDKSAWGYSVSKTALNMATKCMHTNLKKQGFIVIALAPGHNKTDMGTDRAKMEPEESIGEIIPLIDGLKPNQSGRFWYYDGSELPW
jgi:NAD(P)-dependent dehydrogenase (short-subunit alcohol dehydrogenase family)